MCSLFSMMCCVFWLWYLTGKLSYFYVTLPCLSFNHLNGSYKSTLFNLVCCVIILCHLSDVLTAGTNSNIYASVPLPGQQQQQQQHGGNTVVVVHSSASRSKNSENERDSESITLDQFLHECNKSPKSRVCRLFSSVRTRCFYTTVEI